MLRAEMKEKILQNNYLEISYETYLEFRKTEDYNEVYKFNILQELNEFFEETSIQVDNVAEIARKIRDKNPSKGSFVHWSNTADLLEFAQEQPEVVTEHWNDLYDVSISLKERIARFRQAGKAFKEDISLGAPLFGYLLAAYNCEKYPLYKQKIFQEIKRDFGIEHTLSSVSEVYADYMMFCETILNEVRKIDRKTTMIHIQDYIYCSTRYDWTIVKNALTYLYQFAKRLRKFQKDPATFLEAIKDLDIEILKDRWQFYKGEEKVRKIRFILLDQIINGIDVTLDDLEMIKNNVRSEYDKNILQSWTNFSILFQIYYAHQKPKIQHELFKIHQAIRNIPELSELSFEANQKLNGFDWNQTYGTDEAWLAVYEDKYHTHQIAPQYFVSVDGEKIRYGLVYGSKHPLRGTKDMDEITAMDEFSYKAFCHKFIHIFKHLKKQSKDQRELPKSSLIETEELFEMKTWMKMLQNKEIFTPQNLEFLYKIYELGGEATGSDLAKELNISHQVINGSIVQLARRVSSHAKVSLPQKEDGVECHWCLFFNGYYQDSDNLFVWMLKDNLSKAVSHLIEEDTSKNPSYSKEEFLDEVFVDEETFKTMAHLLKYKQNIIIQGPPGVGKTFVTKRLAYALMEEQDDSRIEMIQFHQNYSYEDFVMGYRPDGKGGFSRQNGIFFDFCKRAEIDPGNDYYFIIDEINRGNLSKIFGELFMLIEKDKRNQSVTMSYSKETFTIPRNVYLIGTMNTADRSLAQLEVALRRRFAFITLDPQFNNKWEDYMLEQGLSRYMIDKILTAVENINQEIHDDFQLGRGYMIGHSFFTSDLMIHDEELWFKHVIAYEIKPLLEEYYFDRQEKISEMLAGL